MRSLSFAATASECWKSRGKTFPFCMQYTPEQLRGDREFILEGSRRQGGVFKFVPKDFCW